MTDHKKIIAAGHLCLDITPAFSDHTYKNVDEFLSPGMLLQVGPAAVHPGGSVGNTGLALHKLGADVTLLGKIGDDAFGVLLKNVLEKDHGVIRLTTVPGGITSYTIVIAPSGIDRMFLHAVGCNHTYSLEDMDFSLIAQADHFHFGYPPLLRNFYMNRGENLLTLYRTVKEMGLTTSLDMVSFAEGTEPDTVDWADLLTRVLPYVDFFLPSAEEICYMIDRPRYREWIKRAQGQDVTTVLDMEKDIVPLADKLLSMGAKAVLIKCGVPGMYLKTAGAEQMAKAGERFRSWADRSIFEASYVPDRVLSATGAGDTSIAAFLTTMVDGCPPEECLHLAAATGASCVTAYDSLSGLLPLDELREKIARGWKKVNE